MSSLAQRTPLRIPVKSVNGNWEYFYGGKVPVKEGHIGDLIIDRDSITDPKLLERLLRKSQHKIFEPDVELVAALTIRPETRLEPGLIEHSITPDKLDGKLSADYFSEPRSGSTRFVRLHLLGPTERQKREGAKAGGLWLVIKGTQPEGLISSTVKVPDAVSKDPLDSLNHAFTKLSEKYEPWRKSHTGNVYTRILYRENSGIWYPLDIARQAALAKEEHSHIRDQWALICESLGIGPQVLS